MHPLNDTDFVYILTPHERIVWLSAFLDGEGSYGLYKSYPKIQVGNCDLDSMERTVLILAENGVKIDKTWLYKMSTAKGSPFWRLVLTGDEAIKGMKITLPFTGRRKSDKIKEILSTVLGPNWALQVKDDQ